MFPTTNNPKCLGCIYFYLFIIGLDLRIATAHSASCELAEAFSVVTDKQVGF
jgi:hypothetical protein